MAVPLHPGEKEARLRHGVLFEPRVPVRTGKQQVDRALERTIW